MGCRQTALCVAVALACAAGVAAETREQRAEHEREIGARIERCALAMVKDGGRLVFEEKWSEPVEFPGEDDRELSFRNGSIALADGKVRFTEGLEARVSTPGGSTTYDYTFADGHWRLRGFGAVVGGSSQ